jgi:Family of unknown function (DUF6452)
MKKIIIALLLLLSVFYNCEKDDICSETTPTTPKLIIRFYDISSQEETKNVTGLRVTAFDENNTEVLISNLNVVTADSINLPLRTDADLTKFVFHKEYDIDDNDTPNDTSDDIILGNPDTITITYQREDVYVSRACGFKAIYNDLQTNLESDANNWIVSVEVINTVVENETTAHVKIFH